MGQSKSTFLICIYREPKTCTCDTWKLFGRLRELCLPYKDVIIMGDINLPHCDWLQSSISAVPSANNNMKSFMREYDLLQIVTEPTRGNNLLDVAIVSFRLHKTIADVLPPVASADHKAQKLIIPLNVPLCDTIPNVT